MAGKVDRFTFEIIRHKLFRVTEEAAIALENVSGTPITAEGHDLMVSLYTADGSLLVGGVGFLHHLTSASQAVKHVLANFSEDPGIYEDDVYLFNDSYAAALHAPDVYLISPVHWQGRLAGFVADFVHVTDVGGIDPGGFCPTARESFHEGFSSPGLKLVERGKLRKDVFGTILNLVRDPGMVGLDLKSLMAANHVAKQRMLKIYQDYGFENVDAVGNELIAESERLLRERLLELPDGTWRARQYYDMPDRTMRVELAATKEVDSLTFDFTGTDAQYGYGINCCYWATWGALFAPLFPLLAYDMVWNDGLTKPVKLIAPEGTLVNARRPAPVSIATTGMVHVVNNLSIIVLSKMLGASEKHKNRATGIWAGTHMHYQLAGLKADGQFGIHHSTDGFAGVGGGRAFKDGIDMGGEISAPYSRWANVERHEMDFPHAYLFRQLVPDSGGPGKYRGGLSHELALIPNDTPADSITALIMPGKGTEYTTSPGIFGGYPGCNTASIQFRKANVAELPYNVASIASQDQDYVRFGVTELAKQDIMYLRFDGGGGYGDPLDRDPEAVLEDVLLGLVTTGPGEDIYGVIMDLENKSVDREATREKRLALRTERLGGTKPKVETGTRYEVPRTGKRINEYLQVFGDGDEALVQCTWCGENICPADADWKNHVPSRKSSVARAGPFRVDSGKFFLLEFFCPSCATALDVDVTYLDDPPLIDRVYL
ncbi:MAG: hydantoinase B/oxoprolinase family protein [Chloroflexi bacterium]|nr:hydantoinase B/oxoprolinase family protein [Chloroflexota bacterium]